MRERPHLINITISAVLIIVGLIAYFAAGAVSLVPLIPGMVGVGLLLFSPFMKRDRVIRYLVAILTGLSFVAGLYMSVIALERGTPYDAVSLASWVSFTMMAVIGLIGIIMYGLTYSYRRRFARDVEDAQLRSERRYGEV